MSASNRRSSSARKPPGPISHLDETRDILDQIDTATRLSNHPALSPAVRARLLATTHQLAAQLPLPSEGLVPPHSATPLEPSGPDWVARFPGSKDPQDCASPFREHLVAFLAALKQAGASVQISATFRPPERAYLMHWAWQVAHNATPAPEVPPMPGVNIDWVHRDASGKPDTAASRSAASQMVSAYGIVALPALQSRHTEGRAIDMTISWTGNLQIRDGTGALRTIASMPRSGLNPDLGSCGQSFGVIKAVFAGDPPHWSEDGH